ncbi:hypothetical protein BH09MYX1_BH09MYX1_10980 [soil metagenome]
MAARDATQARDGGHFCPACEKAVDALRAGRVAFVGARFLYFCDATCKTAYFTDGAGHFAAPAISTEIATAEPPRVAPAAELVPATPSAPAATPIVETLKPRVPSVRRITAPIVTDAIEASPTTLRARAIDVGRVEDVDPEEPPRSIPLRPWSSAKSITTEVEPMPASTTTLRARRARSIPAVVLAVGVASGFLSLGAALLGGGGILRFVLAIVAVAAATLHAIIVPQDPSDVWRPARLIPLYGELAIALHARLSSDGGEAYLVACGAGAAAMLLVERVLLRAKDQLAAKRARIADALRGTATMVDGTHVAADAVRAGDVFVVSEGAVVPADGVVLSGEAVVSPYVEASVDVPKRDGDIVVAGARVLSGTLRVSASFGGNERAFARALSLRGRPDVSAPLVRIAARAAREGGVVVLVLVGLATYGTGASLWAALGNGFAAMLAFGASGVVGAACVEHARAHLRALGHGIVIRDASTFERAGMVSRAVVCARGTLLLGEPEILAIEPVGNASETDFLVLAAAMSVGWTHPFGVALLHHASTRGVRPPSFRSVIHQGSGAVAVDASGVRIVLGRRPFLLSEKISVAVVDAAVRAHEEQGRSVLLVAKGDRVTGIIAMQDGLRSGARAAIQRLHDADIEPVLLSGESRETCEMRGRSLDIDNLRPDVARGERAEAVRSLAEGGDIVATIGTPALDEEALGAADVTVALGTDGSATTEHPITIASHDVRDAVLALVLPRIARERSRTALALGLAPGVAFALAVSFGILSPAVAPISLLLGASLAILYAKE